MNWAAVGKYLWEHKETLWLAILTLIGALTAGGWNPPW